MTALITAEQLATFLGRPDVDNERGTLVVTLASDLVRASARQAITAVPDDVITISPTPSRMYLFLPELPVTGVSKIEILDNSSSWVIVDPTTYAWHTDGSIIRRHGAHLGGWRRWPSIVRVTYSHGREPLPAELTAVALAVAARMYANPLGVSQETLGMHSASYVARAALTPAEEEIVGRYALGATS